MSIIRVAIFGAGGLGREVAEMLRDAAAAGLPLSPLGFVVDAAFDAPAKVHGLPVWRDAAALLRQDPSVRILIAIGNPTRRAEAVRRVEALAGPRFATLIHPRALVGRTVTVGPGSVVAGLSSITADVTVGRHVLVNPGVTIAHDCRIGDFVSIGPGTALAGGVVVEDGAELGVGARVMPHCRIGRSAFVGAGAVVIRDVEAGRTAVGVPARLLAARQEAPSG
ncbi:acetyltransferase [Paeniroseomonas aquatica]|uniref:Acetyltransferase n=1 Tax=Paeniroseomonas aquatica TaxID=373043 RepID=A0ABT8ABR6_9PROT|nr:acetyltransferase [Paeniroseomonas aquatica]MDN3567125.1 acetyltransferase [Paeniroseomonas aquatica]